LVIHSSIIVAVNKKIKIKGVGQMKRATKILSLLLLIALIASLAMGCTKEEPVIEETPEVEEAAKESGIYVVAGSMPELEGNHVYNTSYVFDRKGEKIAKHRKMHLFDIDVEGGQYFKESDVLTPGKDVTVFDTEFCRIGLGICYDIRFPELSRLMVLEGAEVLVYPGAFNITTGPAHWELNFRGRALDNQVYTIGVAPARDMESSYHSYGNSIVASPWGNVLNRMDEKEGFVVQEIDLDYVKKVREQLPLLKHLRRDIYKLSKL
jgi:omega-amidase